MILDTASCMTVKTTVESQFSATVSEGDFVNRPVEGNRQRCRTDAHETMVQPVLGLQGILANNSATNWASLDVN